MQGFIHLVIMDNTLHTKIQELINNPNYFVTQEITYLSTVNNSRTVSSFDIIIEQDPLIVELTEMLNSIEISNKLIKEIESTYKGCGIVLKLIDKELIGILFTPKGCIEFKCKDNRIFD